jgi:hypothetical protein
MTHGEVFGHGRRLAEPGRFVDDDGEPDQGIRHAPDSAALVASLRAGRVLVPVVAVANAVEEVAGLSVEKSSDMAVVSMVAADGRRGLLAFTGVDSLQVWDRSARPVPVSGIDAARAAVDDGCEALVLDVAGPRTQVISEIDLLALAGVDPREHARHLVESAFEGAFASTQVEVTVHGGRLRVHSLDPTITAGDLAASLTPRILGLVPEGVEVVDG